MKTTFTVLLVLFAFVSLSACSTTMQQRGGESNTAKSHDQDEDQDPFETLDVKYTMPSGAD